MKLVMLSDTHGQHEKVQVPEGDVLIHAGDVAEGYLPGNTRDFLAWFAAHPHEHKIMIAGNHDFWIQQNTQEFLSVLPAGVAYLQDEFCTIDGVKFWGTPWVPNLLHWAFHERPEQAQRRWSMVDTDVDVLITHGPPSGILDELAGGGPAVGCPHLREYVDTWRPFIHVFGHIHECSGVVDHLPSTMFINASVLDENYLLTNEPVVVDL